MRHATLGVVVAALALVVAAAPAAAQADGARDRGAEAGHLAIDYAEVTYHSGWNAVQDDDDRGRDGPTQDQYDATQEALEFALAPTGQDAQYPDVVEKTPEETPLRDFLLLMEDFFADGGLANGTTADTAELVLSVPYSYWDEASTCFPDAMCPSDMEDEPSIWTLMIDQGEAFAEEDLEPVLFDATDRGHDAVDEAASLP